MWDISGRLLAQYNGEDSSPFILEAEFSPDGKHILAPVLNYQPGNGSDVLIFSVSELDGLLTRGCDWLKDYLNNNPQVRERLKVCQSKKFNAQLVVLSKSGTGLRSSILPGVRVTLNNSNKNT
ncbi:MAG: hypothetical protein HC815_31900 [Richelia sp. RM1_1_1]|nr:hypothetical protein [Richelia sp. RM1_1_1]